jgi:hypothetical protein
MDGVIYTISLVVLAIRRSSQTPAAQGRISLYPELCDVTQGPDIQGPVVGQSRGWWDYVPDDPVGSTPQPVSGVFGTTKNPIKGNAGFEGGGFNPVPRKPSLKLDIPLTHPMRRAPPLKYGLTTQGLDQVSPTSKPVSAPFFSKRYSKLISKVSVFRDALRNEVSGVPGELHTETNSHQLYYTAFASGLSCTTAILTAVGVNGEYLWGVSGWVALDCKTIVFCYGSFSRDQKGVVMSCLAFYSFDQVLRRREHEAILRERQDWSPILRQRHRFTASASALTSELVNNATRRPWRIADRQISPGGIQNLTSERPRSHSIVSWRSDVWVLGRRSIIDVDPFDDSAAISSDDAEPPLPPLPFRSSNASIPVALTSEVEK